MSEPTVLKHGSNAKETKLYFICAYCECEYWQEKQFCQREEDEYYGFVYDLCDCPECGSRNQGMSYEEYKSKTGR